jgi:hypothetical protein
VHFAFVLPTQTKEDFLGYGILFLGLRAILLRRHASVAMWSIVGGFTRETLLVPPAVYFLVAADR